MITGLLRLGIAVAVVCTTATGTVSASSVDSAARGRPNIVLIVTDDQRWDTMWAMPLVAEVLGGHGITFDNSFVVNPECCPSRASLLTGTYSHTTRIYGNTGPRGGYVAFRDSNTIATALDRVGYTTALYGKYLNGYGVGETPRLRIPPGWDDWSAFWGGNDYYGYALATRRGVVRYGHEANDYSTSVLGRKTVSFVSGAKEPFFVDFAPYAPHAPAVAPPGAAGAYDAFPWLKPPSYDERNVRDKPKFVQDLGRLSPGQRRLTSEFRRRQLESALGVDRWVHTIVQALERRGVLERTVLVFTSDNGVTWGAHRLPARSKWAAYEEAIRVPLLIRFDRMLRQQPRHEPRIVLNIDLAPTLAALAGTSLPGAEGRSLLPLLKTPAARDWRREFLVEHLARPNTQGVPTYCAVRTERYKYVVYATRETELYDLVRDPHELRNLASRPSTGGIRRALETRLNALCRPRPPGLERVGVSRKP